ncbi:MAG: multiphosphoryl transfer protein [Actinomycetota bacterium]|jgi:phosphoenolpyruvate-protein kinase (PTS system EI component)|nr:multiphosphoryl transfer protein [Actinomycetota bacterium]
MSTTYDGVACSGGLATAPAWSPRASASAVGPVAATPASVSAAFEAAAVRLLALASSYRRDGATASADILETEAFIARDPTFVGEVISDLAAAPSLDAADCVRMVAHRHAAVMESLAADGLRERAADIREVGRRVIDELTGRARPVPPDGQVVLVDEEVCAPDLLEFADRLVGAVSLRGGASSHAAIVARSLGLPLVSQVDAAVLRTPDGVLLEVDGEAGRVCVDPARAPSVVGESAEAVAVSRSLPATTRDGVDVRLLANIASPLEARRAVDAGAAGVGLLRTELLFLDGDTWPTAEQHEAQLRPILEVLAGRPVVVRLLDFSNDKVPAFVQPLLAASGSAPVLLAARAALDAQLWAILRAGRGHDVHVLVPMVTQPEELELVRSRLSVLADGQPVPPVGAMIESPVAVDDLAALLPVADFLSIGTNDLTATTLGFERSDPRLRPALAGRPEVMTQVERVVRLASANGVPVSVCGDAAADSAVLPLLLEAGVTTVSVAPSRLDAVRALVRAQSVRTVGARRG